MEPSVEEVSEGTTCVSSTTMSSMVKAVEISTRFLNDETFRDSSDDSKKKNVISTWCRLRGSLSKLWMLHTLKTNSNRTHRVVIYFTCESNPGKWPRNYLNENIIQWMWCEIWKCCWESNNWLTGSNKYHKYSHFCTIVFSSTFSPKVRENEESEDFMVMLIDCSIHHQVWLKLKINFVEYYVHA